MCQLIIYKMESILLLPLMQAVSKPEIAKEASDQIFVKSIKIAELRRNLEVEQTKQWHWYIRTIVQWHAVAYLLSELCVREPDDNVTCAWNMLDSVFQDWKNFREQGAPGVLWMPMKKFIARARHKRELDLNAAKEAEAAKLQISTHQNLNPDPNPLPASTNPTTGTNISENPSNVPHPTYRGAVGGYQAPWLQQPVQPHYPTASTPTPWLLEDSAMQELGLGMNALDANMQWEGLDDLMQEFHPSLVEAPDTTAASSAGWDVFWWKMD